MYRHYTSNDPVHMYKRPMIHVILSVSISLLWWSFSCNTKDRGWDIKLSHLNNWFLLKGMEMMHCKKVSNIYFLQFRLIKTGMCTKVIIIHYQLTANLTYHLSFDTRIHFGKSTITPFPPTHKTTDKQHKKGRERDKETKLYTLCM